MGFLDYRITYKLAPTPEGEEHPNIERVDLRKPLTDELIDVLAHAMVKGDKSVNWLCRAIEAEHGIE